MTYTVKYNWSTNILEPFLQKGFCVRLPDRALGRENDHGGEARCGGGRGGNNMSRLPDARLDLVSTAALETLLMAHSTIANCVRNCPVSGVISNVTIPALKAWAQQTTTADQNPSSMPAQYNQMLLQIQTSEDHHCKAWQALGQSPRSSPSTSLNTLTDVTAL